MVRGVLFDYGGVLADGGTGTSLAVRIGEMLGIEAGLAKATIIPLWRQYVRGQITEVNFWEGIEKAFELAISPEQRDAWNDWWHYEPYPVMIEARRQLRAAGYQVGLLTNVVPNTKEIIQAAGGYHDVDFALFSCDIGYAKPDPEIYELALTKFVFLKPAEIVFIDDQRLCLPPAEALGMKTILAETTEQVVADMRRLGLPV